MVLVYSATLDNAINLETVKDKELLNTFEQSISNIKFNKVYTLTFNPTIQKENGELTNAIFDKMGIEETYGQRYIVDKRSGLDDDLGEMHSFKVVEINNSKIIECTVAIKDPVKNTSYIDQLDNGNYKVTSNMKEYELGGKPFVKNGGAA